MIIDDYNGKTNYMLYANMLSYDDKAEFVKFLQSTTYTYRGFKVLMTNVTWLTWEKFRHIVRANRNLLSLTRTQRFIIYNNRKWPKSADYYVQTDQYFTNIREKTNVPGCTLVFEDLEEVFMPKLKATLKSQLTPNP